MAQSLSNLLIHLVFSTKYRAPLINADMEPELYLLAKSIVRNMNAPVIEIGGTEDHLHFLLVLPRTGMISDIVRNLKSVSTRWVKEKDPTQTTFGWQRGYGAFSVAPSTLDRVVQYIRCQKEHHQRQILVQRYLVSRAQFHLCA